MTRAALVVLAACGRIGFGAVADATDGPTLGFCASQQPPPTLCEDFDSGLGPMWNNSEQFGGTYAVDSSMAVSPPASLLASLDAIATTATEAAYIEAMQFGMTTTRATTSFELRFDTAGSGDIVVASLYVDDGTQTHDIELVHRASPQPSYVEDVVIPSGAAAMYTSYGLPAISDGDWHAVTMDLQPTLVTIVIDGSTALSMAPAASNGGMTSLQIGGVYLAGPTTAWQLHVDNVTVQLQ